MLTKFKTDGHGIIIFNYICNVKLRKECNLLELSVG